MKFFTPELYLQFNSRDSRQVEEAHAAWERAITDYVKHLKGVRRQLTPQVRKLAESLCLHDALLEDITYQPELSQIVVRNNGTHSHLVYFVSQTPLIEQTKQTWPFSKEQVHWLYDEFDVADEGLQQHEILLSDGRIITQRFYEMTVFKHELATEQLSQGRAEPSRRKTGT